MPRRPRIHLPGVPIHLVQRGHNREACFFADEDFLAYREWLGDALKKTGCALHAYVLMTNHVHLLLTPPSAEAVSHLIMSLGRRYVQYINKTYRRTGTLWDSRYKSSLVHAEVLFVALPTLHRTESGARRHDRRSRPLPLEQLSQQWPGTSRCVADATCTCILPWIGDAANRRRRCIGSCFAASLIMKRWRIFVWRWSKGSHWARGGFSTRLSA